jgi:TM2 domain-containing membrane protein YozV
MDSQKVDMYILTNGKYFESHHIPQIRDRLIQMDDNQWVLLQSAPLKDPQTALIISIFLGGMGIDRFYIGDTGLGVGKLLTCGGIYIWYAIDWFLIQGATRQKNFEKIQPFLY